MKDSDTSSTTPIHLIVDVIKKKGGGGQNVKRVKTSQ